MDSNNVNVLHAGNPINDSHVSTPHHHSNFRLNPYLAATHRFGELTPHFVARGISGDTLNLRCQHDLRTLSLKAPLMQSISMKKDYFAIPLQAILPFQWDRIYNNPNIGDDVPDDAYCNISQFDTRISQYINKLFSYCCDAYDLFYDSKTEANAKALIEYLLNFFIQAEYFYSDGSLLNYLGYSNVDAKYFKDSGTTRFSFDTVFDEFFTKIFGDGSGKLDLLELSLADGSTIFYASDSKKKEFAYSSNYLSLRSVIEQVRDNGGCKVLTIHKSGADYGELVDFGTDYLASGRFASDSYIVSSADLSRLFAYQIVCAHYYSNDRVDYIYSAELYRQNIKSCLESYAEVDGGSLEELIGRLDFDWNGLTLPYDYCSAFFFENVISSAINNSNDTDYVVAFGSYLSLIFAFRHSLRFVDYFTGSKTSPLAVGNTDVAVSGGNVSVVDVTRNIQIQRFLNAVNRSGRKISSYIKSLFGVDVKQDYHDPIFLGHTNDVCFGSDVSNTGDSQLSEANSVTSVLHSNASRYAFEYIPDRECIVLGITYYDIPRYYSRATDRELFISNRFDMFNPYLEFIGDQPISMRELTTISSSSDSPVFGYTTRYMEYRQKFMRAVGGFVRYLPGFLFIADNVDGLRRAKNLSPSYIRSSNVELDEFFVSLTGYSLASYFHFIVISENELNASRPMSVSPNIL